VHGRRCKACTVPALLGVPGDVVVVGAPSFSRLLTVELRLSAVYGS